MRITSVPATAGGPAVSSPYFSVTEKLTFYQTALRSLTRMMSFQEHGVLMHLIDRAVGYGKAFCYTTVESLMNGSLCGRWSGINLSASTIKRCLEGLVSKGFIVKTGVPRKGTKIEINLRKLEEEVGKVNIPKRLKSVQREPIEGTEEGSNGVSVTFVENNKPFTTFSIETAESPGEQAPRQPQPLGLSGQVKEKISAAINRVTSFSAERLAAKSTKLNAFAYEAVWQKAFATTFPGSGITPKWTKIEAAMVKKASKRFGTEHEQRFPEFLEWAVTNWVQVVRKKFQWMTKSPPPAVPELRFFIKWYVEFAGEWASHDVLAWMNRPERTQLERLIAKGMGREEAIMQIAKDRAVESIRDEVEKKLQSAKAMMAMSEQAVRMAERVSFTKANVHPRSRTAMEAKRSVLQPVADGRTFNPDDLKSIPKWEE